MNGNEYERRIWLGEEISYAGDAGFDEDRTLWLWIKEPISMLTIAAVFSEKESTDKIRYTIGETTAGEWSGFTELYALKRKADGGTDIGLRRPETQAEAREYV